MRKIVILIVMVLILSVSPMFGQPPRGPIQPIPLDGGELVFIFMGILLWIRRTSESGVLATKYKFLNISRKEYRRYVWIMLLLVSIFMPIGALSDTIYIDMNIVALGWLTLIVILQLRAAIKQTTKLISTGKGLYSWCLLYLL